MKVELIEQLGITPTPGGIDKLLQLQDTQNYSESIINPTYGRMADIEGLMEMEMERNDPYVGLQIRKGFNDGGIVNLWDGGEAAEVWTDEDEVRRLEKLFGRTSGWEESSWDRDPQMDPYRYGSQGDDDWANLQRWADLQKTDYTNWMDRQIAESDVYGYDEDERERQYLETQKNIQTASGHSEEENENDARAIWNEEEWKWSEERDEWVSSDYVVPENPYDPKEVPIEEVEVTAEKRPTGEEDEKAIEEITATAKKPAWDWTKILGGILPILGIGSLSAAGSPLSTVQTQSNIPESEKAIESEIEKAIEEITVTAKPKTGILGGLTPEQIATATGVASAVASPASATATDVSSSGEPTMEEIIATGTRQDSLLQEILAGLGGVGGIGGLLDVTGLNAPGATTDYLERLKQLSDLLSGGGGATADSGAVYLPGGSADMAPIYYPFASEPTKAYNIAQGGPFSFMTGPPQESLVQNLGYDNVPGVEYVADGAFIRRNGLTEGPGTTTSDDIPAMLSDGEFVTNAEANRGIGLMALMNQGAPQQAMMDPEQQRLAGARQMYLQQALGQQMARKMRGG